MTASMQVRSLALLLLPAMLSAEPRNESIATDSVKAPEQLEEGHVHSHGD